MEALVVYSSNNCPNCVNLKKALSLKGVAFEEINVTEKPEAAQLLRDQNMRTLPVMNDNGNWMMGFTPSNLIKVLQARAAIPA